MKKLLFIMLFAVFTGPVYAADAGVSISVGEPGFYGEIQIGSAPRPALIYPQPIIIQPGPVRVVGPPIYLHVPPGHAKNWKKFCARYNACGRPVYFVRDRWYNEVYVPHYRSHREEYRTEGRGYRDDRESGNRWGGERGHIREERWH